MEQENQPKWKSGIAILEDNVYSRHSIPDESPVIEKRKDPRFAVHVPLQYRIRQSECAWSSAESIDVSNTGVRLNLDQPAPIGTKIELDVQLPGSTKNILIEGTVVWSRPSPATPSGIECGIAFHNLRQVTGKEKLFQFMTDRLCQLAIRCTSKNLHCLTATTLPDLKSAYHLVYKEYLARGYCEANKSLMHYSVYCVLPDTRTFILKRENHLLGTITLIGDSPCGLPTETLFKEPISQLRTSGRKLAEVSLLALDHQAFLKKSFSLTDFQKMTGTFLLFKALFDYAQGVSKITDIIIAVHPKHEDLYRYLSFEPLADPRPYDAACGKPALPMRLDIPRALATIPESRGLIRFFVKQPSVLNKISSQEYLWDIPALNEMLLGTNRLWDNLPPVYRKHLCRIYPQFKPTRNE